ncbi:gastrula zinc finger protein XlCGF53.1-like [Lithobates pipiens]
MTAPMRMEEVWSHMIEKILNLTLEIIYLLTGERFPLVKSGDHITITVPPCDSLKPKRPNMQKVLEVTKKMMELLTGEVSGVGNSGTLSSNRQGMCLDGDCIIVCVRFL